MSLTESAPATGLIDDGDGVSRSLSLAQLALGAKGCIVAWRDAGGGVHARSVGSGERLERAATLPLGRHDMDHLEVPPGLWWAPLELIDGAPFGLLVVEPEEVLREELAAEVASHVAQVVASSLAASEMTAAYEALVEVSSQLHAEELNTDEILALIVRQARRLMDVDVTWLALLDDRQPRLVVKVASGATTDDFVRMWVQVGRGVGGLAVADRRPVIVRDHRLYDHPTTELIRRTLEAEGVVSLLAVPMIFNGVAVGALYGGSRTPTGFSTAAVSVFTALAGQAAVSITNSRLYRDLAAKNDSLERTFAIHEHLTGAALAGDGVKGIAQSLEEILGRAVFVEAPGQTDHSVASADALRMPIVAGEEELGCLAVGGNEPLSDLHRNAMHQGATVLALEMMKERAALEAEWRLRGELLEEILQADGNWSEGLAVRSRHLGVDLDEPRCVAVVEPHDPAAVSVLQFVVRARLSRDLRNGSALMASRGERVIVALALPPRQARETLEALLDRANKSGSTSSAGLSSPRRNLTIALKEATTALSVARKSTDSSVVAHNRLGPLRFVLDAPDTAQMAELVREHLGPVATYDRSRGTGEILETLHAYLALGGNRAAVAERCHVHESTVKYRMRKAADLLGVTLSHPRVRFELTLAFEMLDVLLMLDVDAFASPASH